MLRAYKYLGFIAENINLLFGLDIAVPEIELPIGISFFTFQILSYVLDVYRKDVAAQKNFYIVAVYLCAFPQLIAGPVVRYSTVENELTEREVSLDDVYAGVRRFIVGLAKKCSSPIRWRPLRTGYFRMTRLMRHCGGMDRGAGLCRSDLL